jgi:predicted ATPase
MSLITAQLPVRLTPLVGRESELNGPGGTGNTRLALAAARSARESFPAGVCWVELAQIEDPGIVVQTLASRLGVPDTPGQDPAEAVAEYVGDHQVLVVLDNCEHLAGATASLTENLLAACPALTVLATSREALGVEGELKWQVPPLSLPKAGPGSGLTASALAASDAVKLFEQRAQLVRRRTGTWTPGFTSLERDGTRGSSRSGGAAAGAGPRRGRGRGAGGAGGAGRGALARGVNHGPFG